MTKKFTTLMLAVLCAFNLMAQSNNDHGTNLPASTKSITTYPASDVQFWCGTGSSSAIIVVGYDDATTPIAYVWGVHFNGTNLVVTDLFDSISLYDSRVSYTMSGSLLTAFDFNYGTSTPTGHSTWWCYMKDNVWCSTYDSQGVTNGDVFVMSSDCSFTLNLSDAVAVTNPNAPQTPTPVEADIDSADILYWVGTGSNSARFIVNWADTALAWGYHFNGTTTAGQMMNDIAAADPRLSYNGDPSWISDIYFVENGDTLRGTSGHYWMSNINGTMANVATSQTLVDGDMFKFGDDAVAIWTDSMEWDGVWYASAQVWTTTVYPVSIPSAPEAEEATIAEDDILFWIGQGSSKYTLIVNWADTVLAWGYRSWMDSVTVEEIMGQVMVNDSRFSYSAGGGFVNDITFTENGHTFAITPGQYWSYNINGESAQMLYNAQYVHNHDMVKWGDPSVATVTDSMEWGGVWYPSAMVWTMPVNPASVVEPEHGPFCGAVGTEGCDAIAANSTSIIAWASACELVRGYQNIAEEGSVVSYGEAEDAVGACDTVDNLSVVSLGDGGTATLTFEGHIYNGEGPDFAVFENGFDDNFLELAFVEVSSDGEHFVRFPATSLTQTIIQVGGIGTIDPTYINNLAGKYRHGWGTPFDLSELRDSANLDINNITHVRIVDVVGSIDPEYASYDAFGNMVNDPYPTNNYSGGFDLDGIGVMHFSNGNEGIDAVSEEISLYPNPATDMVRISYGNGDEFTATVYDLAGRVMMEHKGADSIVINTTSLSNGVYMVRINELVSKLVVRH